MNRPGPVSPSTSDGAILIAAAGWHDESPGGANKLPTDFARYLAARAYRVVYLCASNRVERASAALVDGVDLRRYPSPRAPSPSLANLREHWKATRAIVRSLAARQPIAVLLGHAPLQTLAAASLCGDGVRRCYGVHSPLRAELTEGWRGQGTLKHRLAGRLATLLERRLVALSNVVHCDSEYSRRLLQSAHPATLDGKAIVLPGWVDTTRFQIPAEPRDDLRMRLGPPWTMGTPTFFTLRRLVPRMGLDTAIEAVALLARRGRGCRFVIGGEGPERPRLEALAVSRGVADRVSFLGHLVEERLSDSYAAADCFLLPTRALECFGLIVLEAFASGLPVVGVPVGSIPELVGGAFTEWIAGDNSATALADRMDDFLAGRLVVDPAKLRARALEFAIDRMVPLHERVLIGQRQTDDQS
jgi:glycosyltransferase involved in cell wall biosynthesis